MQDNENRLMVEINPEPVFYGQPYFVEPSPKDHRKIANKKMHLRRKKLLFSANMRRIIRIFAA